VTPPRRIRATRIIKVLYGFGDASKGDLDGALILAIAFVSNLENGVKIFKKKESSNCREFSNLVNALLRAAEEGRLKGAGIFLFTDNQAAEGAYYHGTSPSRAQFELVVTLYKLQMKYDLLLHVIWITGNRIIQQGIDCLSRGEEMGPATQGLSLI
jgi:hypothetical protein